jgi:L-iditol 2-dehydrogenase
LINILWFVIFSGVFMKAQALVGLQKMSLVDWDKPVISNDDDVLLRVRVIGVCGSDVHYYTRGRIGSQVVEYPYLIGHECSAVVEEVGAGVSGVKVGDEVAVEPAVSCLQCDQCRIERENTCRNLSFLGTPGQGDGCMCEYIVMPERNCYVTSGDMSLEEAALCEPFTIGVYSAVQGGACAGQIAAILGAGPIGLSVLKALKYFGVDKVYMTDKLDYRCDFAAGCGADWVGNPENTDVAGDIRAAEKGGIDVAYECAGQQSSIDECLEVLRPGGTLVLVGIPQESRISFSIDKLRRKEISVVNIRRQNRAGGRAIEMVASGGVNVADMITHRFGLADAGEAMELVGNYRDGVIKAVVCID